MFVQSGAAKGAGATDRSETGNGSCHETSGKGHARETRLAGRTTTTTGPSQESQHTDVQQSTGVTFFFVCTACYWNGITCNQLKCLFI